MILAVFARNRHPEGYGTSDRRANGYIIVVVRCKNHHQLDMVRNLLATNPDAYRWDARKDEWYAGPYELVFAVPADSVGCSAWLKPGAAIGNSSRPILPGDWLLVGDNRAVAYQDAENIIGRAHALESEQ